MKTGSRWLGEFIERHSGWVALAVALVTVAAVFGASRVEMRTSQDMFISKDSKVYQDYLRLTDEFGGQQVLVLVAGDLDTLLSESNLSAIDHIHDALSGESRVDSVVSPLTFVQTEAEKAVSEGKRSEPAGQLVLDPQFVRSVVFESDGSINPQLGRVVPDGDHLLIAVRLAGGLMRRMPQRLRFATLSNRPASTAPARSSLRVARF